MAGRKIFLVVLSMVMLLGCVGCAGTGSETEQSVIDKRRDAAESYMRKMATFMWRAEEDVYYTRSNSILTDEDLAAYNGTELLKIKAGRLYRGIPYSYSGASAWNFYDYTSEPDEKGIATFSGAHWRGLNGSSGIGACLGNDCSGAIQLAWDFVGSGISLADTKLMVKVFGYLPVGNYTSNANLNSVTSGTCLDNGWDVMLEAYSGLQKADAVVKRTSSYGHTMMVVENHVVRGEDGSIDRKESYITVLHQTSSYMKKEYKEFDPEYGEDVYFTYGVDDKYTYQQLFEEGYLPITCDVFVDPAPVAEDYVRDSEKEYSYDNILSGMFISNRILSAVTITITDQSGQVVMQGTCYEKRQTGLNVFTFNLERFRTQMPELQRGSVVPEELAPGTYHCTHVVRDGHGVEYVMRDFDFTVS